MAPKRRLLAAAATDDPDPQPSQASAVESDDAAPDFAGLVSAFVRCTLFMHANRRAVQRDDYIHNVFDVSHHQPRLFQAVVQGATALLRDTFDFVVHTKDPQGPRQGAVKTYLLVAITRDSPEETQSHLQSIPRTRTETCDLGLLTVVLGFIQYNGGSMTEELLWHHLQDVGIAGADPAGDFGEPPARLLETFVRCKYLEKVRPRSEDPRARPTDGTGGVWIYSQGPRADCEQLRDRDATFAATLWNVPLVVNVDHDPD